LVNIDCEFVSGDIRNESLIDKLVSENDLVLHMAAALGVDKIMRDPIESISVNIHGSEVVLKSSAKYGKRTLIASTSEIYGKNPKQPLSEEDDRVIGTPQNIRWSYSDAKAIEESMARTLNIQKGLPVTTARFFNTVGPGQTGKYGMVVPRFVTAALRNEDIVIFGNGNQTRVFCHVEDAVNGVTSLLDESSTIGEVFNIGGIEEVTINELASLVVEVTGSKSKVRHKSYEDAYPVGYEDMQRRVPDTSKLRKFTHWEPVHDLRSLITDVVKSLL
jgi:UDP-glucose 4-epimerase